jgi:hypothetical protein
VPVSQLVEPPVPQVRVIRAGEGPRIESEHATYAATLLAVGSPHARRDLYRIEQEPGTVRDAEAHVPGSVEHVIITTGRMRAGPVGAMIELGPGDYASFRGEEPHSYEALEPRHHRRPDDEPQPERSPSTHAAAMIHRCLAVAAKASARSDNHRQVRRSWSPGVARRS